MATILTTTSFGSSGLRFLATDANGSPLTSSDVSSIRYSIYSDDGYTLTPVTGHQNVTIPNSALGTVRTFPGSTDTYNFEYEIPSSSSNPFPTTRTQYRLVIAFSDSTGNKWSNEITLKTK